jgi:hypothetical protein
MIKLIVINLILLFPVFVFAAGTWNHRQVKTLNDGSVLVEFTRQTTGEVRITHFSRVIGDGSDQLNRKKWNLEVAWSLLNSFDLGENSKEILIKLIKTIRNNPNLTVNQVTTWYDTNYSDAMWKGTELLKRMQAKVEEETGVTVTWVQFKTYVINYIFEGVDNYVP